jgi:hypothetical protein
MIARIWRRSTRPEHADAYESMLKPELLPGIVAQPWHSHSWLCSRFAPHACAQAGVPVPQRCLVRGKLSQPSDFQGKLQTSARAGTLNLGRQSRHIK